MEKYTKNRIAVMLPCLNEQAALGNVIRDFKKQLPQAEIYVFDNASTDNSVQIAQANGAKVIPVPRRGKGHVVRKMFECIEADYYIMVDADDTYDASRIHDLLKPVREGHADMSVGSRLQEHSSKAFRKFHRFGNRLIQTLINVIFGSQLTDICSGYRVMSRHFVKNIPLLRDGFEVETELTVYSLICGFSILEIPTAYRERGENSYSKLHTFRDGYKVLLTIVWLSRDLRPLLFFGGLSAILILFGLLPLRFVYPELSFLHHTLMFFSISLMMTGLILNTLNVKFSELQALYRRNSQGLSPEVSPPTRRSLLSPKLNSPREEIAN